MFRSIQKVKARQERRPPKGKDPNMGKETSKETATPTMLDCKQAASILSVSPRTVSRMCERGDLRAVKVMSVWRINRAALMQYVGLE